jgi:hypothetical protein
LPAAPADPASVSPDVINIPEVLDEAERRAIELDRRSNVRD